MAEYLLARPDVAVAATAGGAWVGHGSGSFTVTGAAAFDLVSALLPGLDGNRPVEEVVGGFAERARPAAARLLDVLAARGAAVRLAAPAGRYGDDAWLLPHLTPPGGEPPRAVDTGTAVLAGRPAWRDALRAVLDGPRLQLCDAPLDGDVTALARGGLVVLDADALGPGRTVAVQDTLRALGVAHGVAGHAGSRAWVVWSGADADGCWRCLLGSVAARGESGGVPPVAGALAVAALAHATAARCAGITGQPAVLSIAGGTVRAHDGGCRCGRSGRIGGRPAGGRLVRRSLAGPHDEPALQDEHDRIVTTLAGWTDPLLGPFLDLDGGELPQVPFGRARARVLVDGPGGTAVREVRAATLSSREALHQAALAAVELMAGAGRGVGAGWSRDEATYRALLRHTLAAPATAEAPLDVAALDAGGCRDTCLYLLRCVARAGGPAVLRWTATVSADGLHRATGHLAGGGTVRGAGACAAEAVSTALLAHVGGAGTLVALPPHHRTWEQVWRDVTPPAVEPRPQAVPFAAPAVEVVEVVGGR